MDNNNTLTAQELRIGNWINWDNTPMQWDLVDFRNLEDECCYIGEPIPLTEEWLIKFGFKYMDAFGWIKDFITMDGTVAHYSFDLWRGTYSIKNCDLTEVPQEIKYVHELQNLYYCLCGEELTIKDDFGQIHNTPC